MSYLNKCHILFPRRKKVNQNMLPEGKRSLGKPRCRWEDNIKMDLQEVGGGSWGLDGVGSG